MSIRNWVSGAAPLNIQVLLFRDMWLALDIIELLMH